MSRGLGKMQRFWVQVACNNINPWTFDELCRSAFPEAYEPGQEMRPSLKRSLRRALKKLVDERTIIPLGAGGRADPLRYCINPNCLKADDPRVGKIMGHLKPFGFYMKDGGLMISHH
jgi:hypothetical protein